MGYFDEVINRKSTKSVKWDMLDTVFQSEDVLPMWVADTDFKAPEEVNAALRERTEHGIYGYTIADIALKDSIINWNKRRFQWTIQPEWLTFSNGVVTSLNMAIQAFTEPGDHVLIQTPVYPPFYNVIKAHGRNTIINPLLYENNYYQIDFIDLENKFKQGVKLFFFCSPHNPVGRVWKKEELQEILKLCLKYDVLIVSDEIHADLAFPGNNHIPVASLSEEALHQTITCMAPSKAFNLAGLDASYVITANKEKRELLNQAYNKQGFLNMLNTMGNLAMEAAYKHGEPWLNELTYLLESHYHYVKDSFEQYAPQLKVVKTEGTYLLWIDCSGLEMDSKELRKFFINDAKVGINSGIDYGVEGEQFIRMNIGCPRETLEEGVNRIIRAINNLNSR